MTILDLAFVRDSFPAFQQPLPAKTAFFENAGGSYVLGTVMDHYYRFYTENKVQPYGASEICRVAGEQMDRGRQVMADALGVAVDTVTLGPSTTQNLNTLALASTSLVTPGSAVIVTGQDHEANVGAWERLCQRQHAELRIWKVNQNGELDLVQLEPLLDSNVTILCMTHSSNIVGTVNPVQEVIRLARPLSIRVVVDGVSYAPHSWPDIPGLAPDAYCFSTYKTYAPHLGVMYVSPDFAAVLDPQCHYFNRDYPEKQFDAAGPDHASIAALAGIGEYFERSHRHHFGHDEGTLFSRAQAVSSLMNRHENQLGQQLLDGISGLPLQVLGRRQMAGREANIALYSDTVPSARMSHALGLADVAAGNGHFYARRLLENVGIPDPEDGVLRISMAHYNTAEEVERVVATLQPLFW